MRTRTHSRGFYVSFINGLIGCALGFLGGTAVLGIALPSDVVAQGVEVITPAPEGEPFVKVVFED